MTMSCKVCNHVNRLEIDRKLVSGISLASLSRKYDLPHWSLSKHRKNHLSRQLVQAKETRDLFVSKNMLTLIEELLESSRSILRKTENKPKQFGIALKAIAESRRTMEFYFEVIVSIREIRYEEEQKERERSDRGDLSRLTVEELETFRKLIMKIDIFYINSVSKYYLTKVSIV